jgi:hypothetical protein
VLDVYCLDQSIDILFIEERETLFVQHGEGGSSSQDWVGFAFGFIYISN